MGFQSTETAWPGKEAVEGLQFFVATSWLNFKQFIQIVNCLRHEAISVSLDHARYQVGLGLPSNFTPEEALS